MSAQLAPVAQTDWTPPPATTAVTARPMAHVSIDLDPVDTHLVGYGLESPPCDRIYRTSVPRLLDLLDRVGVRATLFVVARDAESEARLWREAVRRGHEIASHSITHRVPFSTLPRLEIERELVESRQRLEAVIGQPVLGFRAPAWDVDEPMFAAIARAGYRYDTSVMPTPALLIGAAMRFLLSAGRMRNVPFARLLRFAVSPRLPYRIAAAGGLWEFPIGVSPLLRVPFTHTLWHMAPAAVCHHTFRAIRRAAGSLSYEIHAADLLDGAGDDIDPRMLRHHGMRLPLTRKIELLEGFLTTLAQEYEVVTYRDALERDAYGPHPSQRG